MKYETKDSLVYRDTILYVPVPGEIVHDSIPIACPEDSLDYISDTVRVKTEFAEATAWLDRGFIKIELKQSGILQIRLDSVLRESYNWEAKYTEIKEQKVIKEKYIPTIYKIAFWAWIGVISIFAARIIKKIILRI